MKPPILKLENLSKGFPIRSPLLRRTLAVVHAVNNVSFTVAAGSSLGIVGESGCGKSTLARLLMRIIPADSGTLTFLGKTLFSAAASEPQKQRTQLQMIFQDAASSLNPRMTVRRLVEEPLNIHKVCRTRSERLSRVKAALAEVELQDTFLARYPHELSGGQKQRVSIARAIILRPKLIIADEAVSALDVSIQAQILNLMQTLKTRFGIAFIFISHDLGVVKYFSEQVLIMYLGCVVEQADTKTIFKHPLHPYTQELMASVLLPVVPTAAQKRNRPTLQGEPPSSINPPAGCHFHPRCLHVLEKCRTVTPVLKQHGKRQWAACHLYDA